MFDFLGRKKITEQLFDKNRELANTNKTLSLLEKLYETSVLTLMPEQMAAKITEIIRNDLNLEIAGVLVFKRLDDSLLPLAFSKSERLTQTLHTLGFLFSEIKIPGIAKREFLKKVVYGKEEMITEDLQEVWQELINVEQVKEIKKQAHIETLLLYPLLKGDGTLGVLLLGFNRDYNKLTVFEKTTIKSCINVIALLLDKAYLYKELQDSYEITKEAYAIEKKAKEELEELDKSKNEYLQQVQHDLRSPLGKIRNFCDMLTSGMMGKLPKKSLDVVQRIDVVAENKIKDVNNFLDARSFQLGKNPVSLKPGIELNAILQEVVADEEQKAKEKNIYLKFEKPAKEFVIEADREKLKSAFFNIISNAINYTQKGGVTVVLENHDTVKISITDTGIGITKEKMATLFNTVFERGKEAKKASPSGRGMGLFLSKKIIEAHHGTVRVESEGEGKGSTFHIELPIH